MIFVIEAALSLGAVMVKFPFPSPLQTAPAMSDHIDMNINTPATVRAK
jgi:hypothetical protein